MKTAINKIKLVVLFTGLVILSSCTNRVAIGTAIGIKVIYQSIPAVAVTVTQYSEHKISEYLKSSAVAKNEKVITGKKVEKKGNNHKIKPVSIGVAREVRLV